MSLKPSYVPKTTTRLLKDLSNINDDTTKLTVLRDYILEHQEELAKVTNSMSRELPQCRLLLMDAITALKEEMVKIEEHMKFGSGTPPMAEFRFGTPHLMGLLPQMGKSIVEDERAISEKYSREKNYFMGYAMKHGRFDHDLIEKAPIDPTLALLDQNPICRKRPFLPPGAGSSAFQKAWNDPRKQVVEGIPNLTAGTESTGHGGPSLKIDHRTLNYQPNPLTQPI